MNSGCSISITYKCLGFVALCQRLSIILTLPWILFFTLTNGGEEKLRIYLFDELRSSVHKGNTVLKWAFHGIISLKMWNNGAFALI